jgi:hypothetical protein
MGTCFDSPFSIIVHLITKLSWVRFASGAYVSLVSNPAMDFGGPEDVGRRVGMFLTCLAFGALSGPPISGAIRSASGGFKAVGYFSGVLEPILICE